MNVFFPVDHNPATLSLASGTGLKALPDVIKISTITRK